MRTDDSSPHTARLFTNGRSQAVRIPRALEFEGVSEVTIRRDGRRLIIEPTRKSWLTFGEGLEPADDDFLEERPEFDTTRVRF